MAKSKNIKTKKPKEIILKSDSSFDELIEDAFNDKNFKKRPEAFFLTAVVKKTKKVKKN